MGAKPKTLKGVVGAKAQTAGQGGNLVPRKPKLQREGGGAENQAQKESCENQNPKGSGCVRKAKTLPRAGECRNPKP